MPDDHFTLGIKHLKGYGGYPQNFEKAIDCFRCAAEQDHPGAQFRLGALLMIKCLITERGETWDKEWDEAWRWLCRAEGQGFPEAVELAPGSIDRGQDVKRFRKMWRNLHMCIPGMEKADWKAFFEQYAHLSP